MAILKIIECDVCRSVKKNTNNWFNYWNTRKNVGIVSSGGGWAEWDETLSKKKGVLSCCGQTCLFLSLSKRIGRIENDAL